MSPKLCWKTGKFELRKSNFSLVTGYVEAERVFRKRRAMSAEKYVCQKSAKEPNNEKIVPKPLSTLSSPSTKNFAILQFQKN